MGTELKSTSLTKWVLNMLRYQKNVFPVQKPLIKCKWPPVRWCPTVVRAVSLAFCHPLADLSIRFWVIALLIAFLWILSLCPRSLMCSLRANTRSRASARSLVRLRSQTKRSDSQLNIRLKWKTNVWFVPQGHESVRNYDLINATRQTIITV